jgi:hypothetical protein
MRHKTSESFDPEAKGGKNRITKAGKYHFLIHPPEGGIETENESKFELECLAAADTDQIGKTAGLRIEFVASNPEFQDTVDRKIATATIALQLVEHLSGQIATVENWKQWKGKDVEFNFEEAAGRQFVAEVKMREFDEKDRETGQPTGKKLQTPDVMWWTMLAATDEKAKGFPRNAEYLSLLDTVGKFLGIGGNGGNGNAAGSTAKPKPAAPPQQQAEPAGESIADPWDAYK